MGIRNVNRSSSNAKYFSLGHKDLVNQISFDSYGKRFVSCSSDHTVKVWDIDKEEGWRLSSSWKAHDSVVLKAVWANARFGQIIATCSLDRCVSIWEENEDCKETNPSWIKRCSFIENMEPITDIVFGPKRLGLVLASCSKDGVFKIYEAPNILDLSQWSIQHEVHLNVGCSCLSWSDSLLLGGCIAIGFDEILCVDLTSDASTELQKYSSTLALLDYDMSKNIWTERQLVLHKNSLLSVNDLCFSPNLGRDYHLLAVASTSLKIYKIYPATNSESLIEEMADLKDHTVEVCKVSWNITGTVLTSSGFDGSVKSWRQNSKAEWYCFFTAPNEDLSSDMKPMDHKNDSSSTNQIGVASGYKFHAT